ncbi:MAG: NAD(P)-dependent alcohol dehydrogenase [Anaerolineaceae bacterium]|nr:NAD(P)-dependent alcohol dehydrogenase [Anaerolineaceae bacterium]
MNEMMKAIVYEKYGPPEVLHLKEVEKPEPKENEVLVKIYATTVTIGDSRMRSFTVPKAQWLFARLYLGIFSPRRKILGMELAGVVEAVGGKVTRFKAGDPVFASTFESDFGGYAEYKCFPENGALAIKPTNISFGDAAASVGAAETALRFLYNTNIQAGQEILIYGASGAVGSNAVQLACNLFDAKVTAVCSTSNLGWVKDLGADRVLDYTSEDFILEEQSYDVFFDAVAKYPQKNAHKALKPGGIYLNVHNDANAKTKLTHLQELERVKELLESGKFKPVIDQVFTMDQIIEAHRYVEKGHKKGNVVITVLASTNE